MKAGDLVKCLRHSPFQTTPVVVIMEYEGESRLGKYWKISDGSRFWYYREEDMELLSESR